jgi:hypothetical protein
MPCTRLTSPTRFAVQVLTLTSRHSHSVQRCGDVLVGPPAGHAAHDGERLLGRVTAVFAGPRLADAQLAMLAALPVNNEHDLADGHTLAYIHAQVQARLAKRSLFFDMPRLLVARTLSLTVLRWQRTRCLVTRAKR